MFTGRLPFTTEYQTALIYSILNEDPPPPTKIRAEIGKELEAVILRCLTKDPNQRYQSGAELLEALQELQRLRALPPRAGEQPRALAQFLKRPVVAAALVVVVLGAVAGGVWMADRNAKIARAREESLPQIRTALRRLPFNVPIAEFTVAQEVREYIGDDPEFREVWEQIATSMSLRTDPPGADVAIRYVGTPNAVWIPLGVSPLVDVEMPRSFIQLRMTKQGYEPRKTLS